LAWWIRFVSLCLMTKAREIVTRLEAVIGVDGAPVRLVSIIEIQLVEHFGLSAIEAAEKAEQCSSQVSRLIFKRLAESETAGTSPVLNIVGSTLDTVVGFCYVLPTDQSSIAGKKQQRIHIDTLLKKIKAITFSEFELFGKRILEELGAGQATVTPHGNDQGIDFFGQFSFGQLSDVPRPFLQLAHDVKLLFAGQAKHYPNRAISTSVVRELIGAISLARTKTFSSDGIDIFGDLDMRPFSPVVTLLFTTGTFSSGALHLAASAGIIAKSGEQLAVFLADRGVGMVRGASGVVFDEAAFERWLSGDSIDDENGIVNESRSVKANGLQRQSKESSCLVSSLEG